MLLALLLVTVFDSDVTVPRSRSRGIPVKLREQPLGVIECAFRSPPGSTLRAFLLRAEEVALLEQGREPEILQGAEATGSEGRFRSPVLPPGRYTVVIDNRNGPAAVVAHARVDVVAVKPVELDSARRRQVTVVSLLLFALAAAGIGWRLQQGMRGP